MVTLNFQLLTGIVKEEKAKKERKKERKKAKPPVGT